VLPGASRFHACTRPRPGRSFHGHPRSGMGWYGGDLARKRYGGSGSRDRPQAEQSRSCSKPAPTTVGERAGIRPFTIHPLTDWPEGSYLPADGLRGQARSGSSPSPCAFRRRTAGQDRDQELGGDVAGLQHVGRLPTCTTGPRAGFTDYKKTARWRSALDRPLRPRQGRLHVPLPTSGKADRAGPSALGMPLAYTTGRTSRPTPHLLDGASALFLPGP